MLRDKGGKGFGSSHLRHSGFAKKKMGMPMTKEAPKTAASSQMPPDHERGQGADGAEHKHTSETHGTQPHPITGVHAVHIHHMGGGKAMTHTHHDGGHIESQDHESIAEAHEHAQSQLPTDDENTENASNDHDADDMQSEAGDMPSLGAMA